MTSRYPRTRFDKLPRLARLLGAVLMIGVLGGFVFASPGRAQSVDDEAHRIGQTLQCPVCEGQSVAESHSQLATQMRTVIREKLTAGENERQITQYFVDRYGESVLRMPPRSGFTAIAWIVPYLAVALAVFFLVRTVGWRKRTPPPVAPSDPALDTYLEEVDRSYDQVRDEALR